MKLKGSYQAWAREWALGKASTGKEQIAVVFEVAEGEAKGQRITWYGYFTEKTHERTLESLEHCGWDGESLRKLDGMGSRACVIVVEDEVNPKDGETYSRVKWVNALGGGLSNKEKLETDELAALEERMKGAMLERKQKRPAQRMRQPGEDEELGF